MSTIVNKVYFLSIRKNISLIRNKENINRYEGWGILFQIQDELSKG